MLEHAIRRHGRNGRDAALAELTAHDPRLADFVAQVRWGVLCEQSLQFAERRYRELWQQISHNANDQESAA